MKTQDEIFEICSVCEKRGFDPKRGIICSLTNDKPYFEENCSYLEIDEKEIVALENKAKEELEELRNRDITGWLALFLWLGIGGGALLSVIRNFIGGYDSDVNLWVNIFSYLQLFILVCTAIGAIVAFYAKKGNAVAWAKTYIAMIALDGLACLIISVLADTTNSLEFVESIRSFFWAATWFMFLLYSVDVEMLIPKKIRFWGKLEKIFLLIYSVLLISFVSAIFYVVSTEDNIIISKSGEIEFAIEEINKETPLKIDEGVNLQKVEIEGNNIIYYYELGMVLKSDFEDYVLNLYNKSLKYSEIQSIINEIDPDLNNFVNTCFDAGYNLKYVYLDDIQEVLYEFEISFADVEFAKNNAIVCPKNDFISIIKEYNEILPMTYMGDATLVDISFSNDSTLTYSVNLPEMSRAELKHYIPFDYLNQYVLENWNALQDPIIQIAELNKMYISFDFNMHNGVNYVTIDVTPQMYNNQLQ